MLHRAHYLFILCQTLYECPRGCMNGLAAPVVCDAEKIRDAAVSCIPLTVKAETAFGLSELELGCAVGTSTCFDRYG